MRFCVLKWIVNIFKFLIIFLKLISLLNFSYPILSIYFIWFNFVDGLQHLLNMLNFDKITYLRRCLVSITTGWYFLSSFICVNISLSYITWYLSFPLFLSFYFLFGSIIGSSFSLKLSKYAIYRYSIALN